MLHTYTIYRDGKKKERLGEFLPLAHSVFLIFTSVGMTRDQGMVRVVVVLVGVLVLAAKFF